MCFDCIPSPARRRPERRNARNAGAIRAAFQGFSGGSPNVEVVFRLLGALITVLFAIAVAVTTWPQFFRLEHTFPFAQIVALRGPLVALLLVATLIFLLLSLARPLRAFALAMAAVALIGGAAGGAIMFSRGIGSGTLPPQTETSLRVMTWNTAGESTPPGTIASAAVAMDADILSLPETNAHAGEAIAIAMRDMGRPMWVLHVNLAPEVKLGPDAWTTTILISPELGDYSVIQSSTDGSSNTTIVPSAVAMPVDGDGPIIVAVHAVAPRESYMETWRDDLRWLGDQCADASVIMAGDFNATVDHMASFGVGDGQLGRCRDAAGDTGNGAVGTWSTRFPALLGAPIDHVMYSTDWQPTGSVVLRSFDQSGSDHRPLVVQLEPAAALESGAGDGR
jgi:endonuclease/exonuclease/phosphatase (EEP) superfamily protein YafD